MENEIKIKIDRSLFFSFFFVFVFVIIILPTTLYLNLICINQKKFERVWIVLHKKKKTAIHSFFKKDVCFICNRCCTFFFILNKKSLFFCLSLRIRITTHQVSVCFADPIFEFTYAFFCLFVCRCWWCNIKQLLVASVAAQDGEACAARGDQCVWRDSCRAGGRSFDTGLCPGATCE